MMKSYLLGIDIGTSACKVAVFDKEGKVLAAANGDYPVYYPQEGWAEQDPEEWWSAVCRATKETVQKAGIDPAEIAGVGIDGQSWSAIAIDKEGKVLTNTPIWMDTRAQDICERLNKEIGEDKIFEVAGNSLQPSYTTAKIIWYKENLPEVYEKIDKILQSNSFIAFKLTGAITQDMSQGYGLHCFDMKKGCWDEEMCRRLGIPMEFLPEICECDHVVGTVTAKAAAEGGISGFAIYSITNFTSISAGPAAAGVSLAFSVSELAYRKSTGAISDEEFKESCQMAALNAAVSAVGAAIGQELIPIPLLGAWIGSFIATQGLERLCDEGFHNALTMSAYEVRKMTQRLEYGTARIAYSSAYTNQAISQAQNLHEETQTLLDDFNRKKR